MVTEILMYESHARAVPLPSGITLNKKCNLSFGETKAN
jgi:hypothetical protein